MADASRTSLPAEFFFDDSAPTRTAMAAAEESKSSLLSTTAKLPKRLVRSMRQIESMQHVLSVKQVTAILDAETIQALELVRDVASTNGKMISNADVARLFQWLGVDSSPKESHARNHLSSRIKHILDPG